MKPPAAHAIRWKRGLRGSPVPTAGDTQASVTLTFAGAVLKPDSENLTLLCLPVPMHIPAALIQRAPILRTLHHVPLHDRGGRHGAQRFRDVGTTGCGQLVCPSPLAQFGRLLRAFWHLGGVPNWLEVPGFWTAVGSSIPAGGMRPGTDIVLCAAFPPSGLCAPWSGTNNHPGCTVFLSSFQPLETPYQLSKCQTE